MSYPSAQLLDETGWCHLPSNPFGYHISLAGISQSPTATLVPVRPIISRHIRTEVVEGVVAYADIAAWVNIEVNPRNNKKKKPDSPM